jgi:hypothetical protein
MHATVRKPTPTEPVSPSFCDGIKINGVEKAFLWQHFSQAPSCPTRVVIQKAAEHHLTISVSLRQINRLRAEWELSRPKGRPRHSTGRGSELMPANTVHVMPRMSFVGVHLFLHWLEQQNALGPVLSQLSLAIEAYKMAHPDDDFVLLHHRQQTLFWRFVALLLAPLLGIERLIEFDRREHPLASLLGHTYHSSSLNQFLAQLERIDAAQALMPCLVPESAGRTAYIDGHMIAFWSPLSMHKGKITMLGRIMAGSQAVVTHNDDGYGIFVAYHPPDMHLSHVIIDYCQQVVQATGIEVFIIDREVNSLKMAQAFSQKDWGLLSMLDSNEHQGLESFEATEVDQLSDGSRVYEARWKAPRPKDPRRFVVVVSADGGVLVYWGTPKVRQCLAPNAWPEVYRKRSELQENSFKRMIDHGALKINYGRKKIWGPDRHQQRRQAEVLGALDKANEKVAKQTDELEVQQQKVLDSEAKGHGKRLEQRQDKLQQLQGELSVVESKQQQLQQQVETLEPLGQRADRDFRKQTIMTFRSLFLENLLMAFMSALGSVMATPVSLEGVLALLFQRSGLRIETPEKVIYWVNSTGLSASNRRVLEEIVKGLCGMDLRVDGKAIEVEARDMPP